MAQTAFTTPGCDSFQVPEVSLAASCPDLRAIAAGGFQLSHDAAFDAVHGRGSRAADPWLVTIPCHFGHVLPWGPGRLAVSTNGRGETAQRMAELPFVRVEHDAADGFTLSFAVEHFDAVAAIARPKQKRRLSAENRKSLLAAGQEFRFSGRSHGSNRPKSERNSTKRPRDDSRHVQASSRPNSAA